MADGKDRSLGAIANTEFADDRAQMVLHRLARDEQHLSDLTVGLTFEVGSQQIELPFGQLLDQLLGYAVVSCRFPLAASPTASG